MRDISKSGRKDGGGPTIGEKCEIRIWQDRVKKDGRRQIVAVDHEEAQDLPDDSKYAIVKRQVFTDKNVIDVTKVDINSPYLLETFRHIVRSHPAVPSDFTKPFEMESPFQMLYHSWDDLVEYRETVENDVTRMHLSLLLEFMRTEIGKDREQCLGMVRKKQITFARLWKIFRPGSMIYTETFGQPWLLRVRKVAYEENSAIGKYMEVHCLYTDYNDDGNVGEAEHVIRIVQKRRFGGEQPSAITDLDVYPAEFVPDLERLMRRLSNRGERLLGLQGVLVKGYDGLAAYLKDFPPDYFHPDMVEWPGVWMPFTETGRVVLDRKTFLEDSSKEAVHFRPPNDDGVVQSPPIGDPLFCCAYAFGYSLIRKEWCKFLIDNIKDIEWNNRAFDGLVMKEDQRLLLEALTTSHTFPEDARNQKRQKGKGLVVLLHGTPGSGKTLSAECAAEATGKALLSTSIGELNKFNRAYNFEYRLKQVLAYATIWKAIVLLDEADVFLEARPEEASANAESLPYTNRIEVFDPAMKSRVHLALTFRPPDFSMRCAIWEQYLKKAQDSDIDVDDAMQTLGREALNGREISNAINTAQTLARFRKERLQLHHIKKVLAVRSEFTKSLDSKKEKAIATARSSSSAALPVRTNSIIFADERAND